MSLLITSSQSKTNTNAIGLEDPSHYTNHLRGSLQIKPNSQIAVDSVKINRDPLLDFQDGVVSMFWFGERLDQKRFNAQNTAIDQVTSWPIVQENTIRSSVGIADFQEGFRIMMREAYCYHPEINTSHTQNASLITKKTLGTGVLDGFDFQFQQNVSVPAKSIPAAEEIINVFQASPAPEYAPASGSITSKDDDTLVLCACEGASNGPISLNNGSVTFNVSNTRQDTAASTRQFAVGLTRAYDHTDALPHFRDKFGLEEDFGLGQDKDVFFDFAASSDGDGKLRLYHFVKQYDGLFEDELGGVMEEIIYYNKANGADSVNNANNSSFASGSPINVSEVTELTFNCKNEVLTVTDQNASVIITVNKSDSASFVRQIPKPINQSCWKMYPQVYLYEVDDLIAISAYHPRNGTTMDSNLFYGKGDWQARCHGDYYTGADYEQDPAKQVVWQGSFFWPSLLESRGWGLQTSTSSIPKNPYKGVDQKLMEDFENIFLVGRNDIYLKDMPINQWQPNNARQLGMSPYTIFPPIASISATVGSSFASDQPPATTSQSSAFIRLPRFTHTTFNAGKGSMSKIISMIPRFDNAGNETGALFFKESDRLYVDLDNSDTINITDIAVDIVRKDETFVEDLTGSTEVVFHIRDKPKM